MVDVISYSRASKVQKQLDQAIANGDQLAETQQARVDTDGISYETLKDRLDAEHLELAGPLAEVQNVLSEQEWQKQVLTHGVQVINSDTPGSLKVEFHGNTLVNLLGKDGLGNFTAVADGTNRIISWNFNSPLPSGKYYLIIYRIDQVSDSVNDNTLYFATKSSGALYQGGSSTAYRTYNSSVGYKYWKVNPTDDLTGLRHMYNDDAIDLISSKYAIYEVDQELYDQIEVSLSDADVERMFNYLNSVQSVVNPVVKVEGSNLLPPFTEISLPDNMEVVDSYKIKINSLSGSKFASYKVRVSPNQNYTLTGVQTEIVNFRHRFFDKNDNLIGSTNYSSFSSELNVTSPSNAYTLEIGIYDDSGDVPSYLEKPMLNLGTTALPFADRSPRYLYAQTTLAGLPGSDKKDVLFYNESLQNPRWEVKREFGFENNFGSLDWKFSQDYAGVKRVSLDMNGVHNSEIVVKYDGSVLSNIATTNDWSIADQSQMNEAGSDLYITISDTDSGWTDAMIPSVDLIKSYFYCYQYRGDGTTHSWRPIGDTDDSRLTTELPTSMAPTVAEGKVQPYELTYQLAEPVIEVEGIDFPTVEGDVSIQGDSQIEIGELVFVREFTNPVQNTATGDYFINSRDDAHPSIPNGSKLSNKTKSIVGIYKNGELDEKWEIRTHSYTYGNYFASIPESDFDTTATYTVTYIALNEGQTAHLNEVKATYNQSMKSSFQGQVSKVSDIATQTGINTNSLYELIKRVDSLESGV